MTIKYPPECILVPVHNLDFSNSERKIFGDLTSLANSIKTHGLIHPPTYKYDSESEMYRCLAGRRRTYAMRMLNMTEIPIITREQDLTEDEMLELELVENVDRLDMTWQEQCMLIHKAHSAYRNRSDEPWGNLHTGKLMKISESHVSHANKVAEEMLKGNQEVAAAKSINEAYTILLKQKENHAVQTLSSMMKKPLKPVTVVPSITPAKQEFSGIIGGRNFDDFFNLDSEPTTINTALPELSVKDSWFDGRLNFPLSEWMHHGDCIEIMSNMEPESVDHIITDPPYGIDIHEGFFTDKTEIEDTHDREDNLKMFPAMMEQFFRIMRKDRYCILFYDYEHQELLRNLAIKVGFKPQIHPVIWQKLHPCKNTAPNQNFTKTHEPAMVLRKGTPMLTRPGISSQVSANAAAERKLYSNVFAKPYAVWEHLINAVVHPGQSVCDPFAGQMSCPRAALTMGIPFLSIEKEKTHFNKGYVDVVNLIQKLTNNKANIS